MLINDYTQKITGLKDVELISVENIDSFMVLDLFIKKQPHNCPRCKYVCKNCEKRFQVPKL